jgi:hypothetical protein
MALGQSGLHLDKKYKQEISLKSND